VIAHRRELMLVAALSGIALAVRVYHLDAVRAFMDEGPFMNALMKMRTDPTVSLTAPLHPVASSTRLFPWTQLIITDLLGDTLSTFRLAGVLFGVATVAATYGLTRLLFDRRTAFLAGLIFATFPPHVHMSRIAIYNIADPLFGVLALLFFVQAIRSRQRLFYALAGASLGLLPYVYEGGELLFPLLLTAWILWLVLSGPPRPSRAGIGWMIFVALAIALPVYYTEWSYSLPLFTRLDDMGLQNRFWLNLLTAPDGLHQMLVYFNEKFLPPLLHYVHNPDASLFYGGQTALVLPIFVPLFLLGLCFTFRYWRRSGALLIFWLLLTTLGNSMIYFNDWTARFVVVMPAVAMLMALGLSHILPLILKAPRWRLYKALAVVICLVQVLYYFGLHLPYYQTQLAELRKHYDVAYRIMALPDDTHVLFFYEDHIQTAFTFSFLDFLGNTRPFDAMQGYEFDPIALSRDENYVIFVDPYNYEVLDKMKAAFYLDGPHYGSPDLPRQFAAYRVTPWLWKDVTEKASLKPVSPHS
jgi:hypothetical protein